MIEEIWHQNGLEYQSYKWCQPHSDDDQPHPVIFMFHGLGDYSGSDSWRSFGDLWFEQGYSVYAYDQTGHGRSAESTTGEVGYVKDSNTLINDATDFVCFIYESEKHHGNKFFLVGASMGGAVSIKTGLTMQNRTDHDIYKYFSGCILLAPALQNSIEPNWFVLNTLRAMCNIGLGFLPIGPPGTGRGWKVINDDLPADQWEWRAQEQCEIARNDPYKRYPRRLIIGTGQQLIEFLLDLQGEVSNITFPFLVLHGTGDAIIPLSSSRMLYFDSSTDNDDKELIIYENVCHALLCDPDWPIMLEDMFKWVRNRLAKE
eukprot:TRINITY_DN2792_c0_g1_i1.p1 TRINITY_DN2792_c0_g1~~TRINITY_DN2792_c0_g1_i1.p1  ORF type:complete len:316 (+),score=75.51 TRINITY_DN2792_c0_g1_i1:181-1128(+)